MKNHYALPYNIAQTLNLVGERWSLLILYSILCGKSTFKELRESLEGIPTNLLSQRLKSLEKDGLIDACLYQSHPPRYRYLLTDSGKDLEDVFNSLSLWGERHLPVCPQMLTHTACGNPIQQRYYCPCCNSEVPREELAADEKSALPL